MPATSKSDLKAIPKQGLLIVTGIHKNGCREILGAKVEANEDEPGWESLFEDLKGRGLKGVQLVVSDGHKGIQKAVEKAFWVPLGRYHRLTSVRVSTKSKRVQCPLHACCTQEYTQKGQGRSGLRITRCS